MRRSVDYIIEKRKNAGSVIFLTGGTGFMGSHIATELLKRGYFTVFLCRPKHDLSAYERVQKVLEWHGLPYNKNFKVVRGQVDEPRLALDDEVYTYLLENVDEIWHCAADTSFLERERKQAEKVNIQGTLNVLKLAAESKCYFFHHMSSAYVAGKVRGRCMEKYVPQRQFYNVYEETKHIAEGHVLETCGREGIRVNIYRPSITYGDSRTGKSLSFKAFYVPFRAGHYLKKLFEKDIEENDGLNAEKMGVRRTEDGKLYMPIRIGKIDGTSFDLVPIDFAVAGCMAIMENCLDGGIFHLVSRKPSTLDELILFGEKFFNAAGYKSVLAEDFVNQPRNALENLFDSFINVYEPNFHDDRIFDDTKAAEILDRNNIVCPYLDYEIFSKCIKYAIETDWGRALP
jgi:nucleoside-diphosphate-sugar epimerase